MAREYVGIDLHRRRSVIVRMDGDGEVLSVVQIDNDPMVFAAEVGRAGPDARVVLEATYGWYWAVELLQREGLEVHMAHPHGLSWGHRRHKDDVVDARDLADMLRLGRLPEAWIAPDATRQLREIVRYRAKLVGVRSGLKAQVHAVLAKEGVRFPIAEIFGPRGSVLLDGLSLGHGYQLRLDSLRNLIGVFDGEVRALEREIAAALAGHAGYQAVQAIPGVGATIGAIFVAEIGDIGRFERPEQLASWAGLTPRHHESDDKVRRGHITKQGSRLLRWAAYEAAMRARGDSLLAPEFRRIAERRGRRIARVAVARKVLTLAFFGLRDGVIRRLAEPDQDAA